MRYDIAASLRRLIPQKHHTPLRRRPDADLLFADAVDAAGGPLLLNTTVYIDALRDRLPAAVAALLRVRSLHHSSVAVGELAHVLGRLDPARPATAGVCVTIEHTIAAIPTHRLLAPTVAVTAEAGILTGLYARLQGLARRDRQPLFNDAQLFLQAQAQGCYLLTRNIGDIDCLQQLLPGGRVLFCRQRA